MAPRSKTAATRTNRLQPGPNPTQSHPIQSYLISPTHISQPAYTRQKLSRDYEVEAATLKEGRPAKQARRSTCHRLQLSGEKLPEDSEAGIKADESEGHSEQSQELPLLSDEDSQSLQFFYEEVMACAPRKAPRWSPSRPSTIPTETETSQTRRTNAVNRRVNLAAINIRFHAEPAYDIETTIIGIVER